MNADDLEKLLCRVRDRSLPVDRALSRLRHMPYEPMGFAAIDHHRALRLGHGEVVFCEGKTPRQVVAIIRRMTAAGAPVLATRAALPLYRSVRKFFPKAAYNPLGRVIIVPARRQNTRRFPAGHSTGKKVLILTAGTSDLPVAEEARATLDYLETPAEILSDVGVAGLHRLLDQRPRIEAAAVLIVVAGMDGALASVVGGWAPQPVIAVPTSVGYGASFGGMAALLTMLNSCAPGVAVVNIDNGFGAAVIAHRIKSLR